MHISAMTFQQLDETYLMYNRFYLWYKIEIKTHQCYFLCNAENEKYFTIKLYIDIILIHLFKATSVESIKIKIP